MRQLLKNVSLSLAFVVLTLFILEYSLALFVDVTDDIEYEHLPKVGLRLKSGQHGIYIRSAIKDGDPIKAHFHINNDGFNNLHDYSKERHPGFYRIAVVGDSFVEALQVDSEQAFFRVLEQTLNRNGLDTEVYSFGVSGFGTAQAYHLIKSYVLQYSPDLIIYLFIPNDVSDSSQVAATSRWTQQYDLSSDGTLFPLPLEIYQLPAHRWVLKQSNLFRYFYYQRHLNQIIQSWKTSQIERGEGESGQAPADKQRAWNIVEALLQKLDRMLAEKRVPWFLVWQGDIDPGFHLNTRKRLERLATQHSLPYFDLSRDFAEDFTIHRRLVRIKGDGHWNRDGHRVVGASLARLVIASLEEAKHDETKSSGMTGN